LAAVSGPKPGSSSNYGATCATQVSDLGLEHVDRLGQLA
jgi:hypothetical protein